MVERRLHEHDEPDGPARPGMGDWRTRARCRREDPELFFPVDERGGPGTRAQIAAAKEVCARCPVRPQCLEWALDALAFGIAGGTTSAERSRLRAAGPQRATRTRGTAELEPAVGAARAEVAACGRAALAAGEAPVAVAERLGVTLRTVERWATRATATRPAPSSAQVTAGGAR